jgi:hypothetical protein
MAQDLNTITFGIRSIDGSMDPRYKMTMKLVECFIQIILYAVLTAAEITDEFEVSEQKVEEKKAKLAEGERQAEVDVHREDRRDDYRDSRLDEVMDRPQDDRRAPRIVRIREERPDRPLNRDPSLDFAQAVRASQISLITLVMRSEGAFQETVYEATNVQGILGMLIQRLISDVSHDGKYDMVKMYREYYSTLRAGVRGNWRYTSSQALHHMMEELKLAIKTTGTQMNVSKALEEVFYCPMEKGRKAALAPSFHPKDDNEMRFNYRNRNDLQIIAMTNIQAHWKLEELEAIKAQTRELVSLAHVMRDRNREIIGRSIQIMQVSALVLLLAVVYAAARSAAVEQLPTFHHDYE